MIRAIRALASEPLLRSAYSLMANVVLTSLLGFMFWVAAARLLPPATVGRDTALVSAMLALSTICQLNLSAIIVRFLGITKIPPRKFIVVAYGTTAVTAGTAAGLFCFVAPRVADSLEFLRQDALLIAAFVTAVALWGVFSLQDAVLTALRRAPWVPLENGVFGVLKIAALPLLITVGMGHALFAAWVIPMVLMIVPVNYLVFSRFLKTRPLPREGLSPVERFGWRGLRRFFAQDYAAAIFMQAASTTLPIVVVGILGSTENAYFYMPFTIISAFDGLFLSVVSSLTVEAALDERRLSELTRTTVRRFALILIAGSSLLVFGAHWVLLPFGAEYAEHGAPVLRILALASIFKASVALFTAVSRVQGRASRILLVQLLTFVAVMTLTFTLGRTDGIRGVAVAWLIANGLAACAAALPTYRVWRGEPPRSSGIAAQ